MPSHPFDYQIQTNLYSTQEMVSLFSERIRFERWLEIERALARVQGRLGIIPAPAAESIDATARMDSIDVNVLREEYGKSRNSLIPLIKALRQACPTEHGEFVHYGATTQDILDTSQVLEIRDVFRILYRDLRALESALTTLTIKHRATPMIGRSHGQQALPITFGLKTASWLAEIRRHLERSKNIYPRIMTGQLSGAVGTMAALGPNGREVSRLTLAELGLHSPTIGWHTARDNIAEAASFMAMVASSCERIAGEVFALAKTETGELNEPALGTAASSSTMPHKRNPVLCQRISVMARHIRALNLTVTEAMVHEHERDTRALWSEWLAVPQISIYTGTTLHYINQVISGLEVDTERMAANLKLHGDVIMSEWLLFRLGESMGKATAHEAVRRLTGLARSSGSTLKACIEADKEISQLLNHEDLARLDHPETYTGEAAAMIDELLLEVERLRQKDPREL
ncbi:MAG: adenylosuccinate lyase family protein [Proteobacteria bacterium]|nr:adenylosuccinate lyase family protein [Pseudomonadota bacterium]MBU1738427.1 adenylosuccinate lyase family protein [Pseudomonadota bacterium]